MVPGVRLVVLGMQGAGKGTQCGRLSVHYVVPHISTGDMFRVAVKEGSEAGQLLAKYMEKGELVPDDVTTHVVRERLSQPDASERGFILDGYPRTAPQAASLSEILAPEDVDLAIDLEIPREEAIVRIASRRVCLECGTIYSALRHREGEPCELCGGVVQQRADDTEDAIARRIDLYLQDTEPLISHYLGRDMLVTIDALGTEDDVFRRLVRAIDHRRGLKR
jgi:adenylate kinase